MAEAADSAGSRRTSILEAATQVFARYGFRKTSMDDLARAAGLSRPGLYLHFPTKEALFKEVVLRIVELTLAQNRAALAREELDVEERVLGSFEAIHRLGVGSAAREHMSELLEAAVQLMGPVMVELDRSLVAELAKVLGSTGVAAAWKEAGVSARELAEHLFAASLGVKQKAPASEYRERMKTAVRIVCRGRAERRTGR